MSKIVYTAPVQISTDDIKHKVFNAILTNGKALEIAYAFYSMTNRWEYLIKFTDKVYMRSWENTEEKMIKSAKAAIESVEALFKE